MHSADDAAGLLLRLSQGDAAVAEQLLALHRERLKRMVSLRFDDRLRSRFDPSDVVQETLVVASQRLVGYAESQPLPFYPWLRGIAWEQLIKFRQRHLGAQMRSVEREEEPALPLNDESVVELVDRLVGAGKSPSEDAVRNEQRRLVRQALSDLPPRDREILELRHLEQLGNEEIAAVLGVSHVAVRVRHFRALDRLNRLLHAEEA